MLRLGRCHLDLEVRTLMVTDSTEMTARYPGETIKDKTVVLTGALRFLPVARAHPAKEVAESPLRRVMRIPSPAANDGIQSICGTVNPSIARQAIALSKRTSRMHSVRGRHSAARNPGMLTSAARYWARNRSRLWQSRRQVTRSHRGYPGADGSDGE